MDSQGFKTKLGKPITVSIVYLMLRNPFYYGYFEFPVNSGNWYKGGHKPLITKETFIEVQKELDDGFVPKIRGKTDFAYKGLFKCYQCGTSVCGEEKFRKRLDGTVRHHIYYHCTKSRNSSCNEGFITEKNLIQQIQNEINKLSNNTIQNCLSKQLIRTIKELEPIVKEIKFYSTSIYEESDAILKDLILYACRKASSQTRRDVIKSLPIAKKLPNRILV